MKQLKRFENGNYSFKKWANDVFKFEKKIKKLTSLFSFPKLEKKIKNCLIIWGINVIEIEKNHVRASPPMLAGYLVSIR